MACPAVNCWFKLCLAINACTACGFAQTKYYIMLVAMSTPSKLLRHGTLNSSVAKI